MFGIITLLQCLLPEIKMTTIRQLSRILMAITQPTQAGFNEDPLGVRLY